MRKKTGVMYGISVYVPDGFDKYEAERDILAYFDELSGGDEDFDDAALRPVVHEGIEPKIIDCTLPTFMYTQFEKWFFQKFARKELA